MRKQSTIIEKPKAAQALEMKTQPKVEAFNRSNSWNRKSKLSSGFNAEQANLLTDEEHTRLTKKKKALLVDLENMNKHIHVLNNEIKSKKNLLEELNKEWDQKNPDAESQELEQTEEILALQADLALKDQKIEDLLNRVRVAEFEYDQVKGFRTAGKKMLEMEAKMKAMQRERVAETNKMNQQAEAFRELKAKLEAQKKDFQHKLETQYHEQQQLLEAQKRECKCQIYRRENEELKKELKAKEDAAMEHANKLKQLQAQLDFQLNDQELKEKNLLLQELQKTSSTMKALIRELEQKLKLKESHGSQAMGELFAQMENDRKQFYAMKAQLQAAQQELQQQLHDCEADRMDAHSRSKALDKECKAHGQEIASLQNQLQLLQLENQNLKTQQLDSHKKFQTELEETLANLNQRRTSRGKKQQQTVSMDDINGDTDRIERQKNLEIRNLKKELAMKEKQRQEELQREMKEEMNLLRSELSNHARETANALKQQRQLEEMEVIKQLRQVLENKEKERNEWLENRERDKSQEIMHLKQQLNHKGHKGATNHLLSGHEESSLAELKEELRQLRKGLASMQSKKQQWLQMLNNGDIETLKKELGKRDPGFSIHKSGTGYIATMGDNQYSTEGDENNGWTNGSNEKSYQEIKQELGHLRNLLANIQSQKKEWLHMLNSGGIDRLMQELSSSDSELIGGRSGKDYLAKSGDRNEDRQRSQSPEWEQNRQEQIQGKLKQELKRLRKEMDRMQSQRIDWLDLLNNGDIETLKQELKNQALSVANDQSKISQLDEDEESLLIDQNSESFERENGEMASKLRQEIKHLREQLGTMQAQRKQWLEMLYNGQVEELKDELKSMFGSAVHVTKYNLFGDEDDGEPTFNEQWANYTFGVKRKIENGPGELRQEIKELRNKLSDMQALQHKWLQMLNNGKINQLKKEMRNQAWAAINSEKEKLLGTEDEDSWFEGEDGEAIEMENQRPEDKGNPQLRQEMNYLRKQLTAFQSKQRLWLEMLGGGQLDQLKKEMSVQDWTAINGEKEISFLGEHGESFGEAVNGQISQSYREMTLQINHLKKLMAAMEGQKQEWLQMLNSDQIDLLKKELSAQLQGTNSNDLGYREMMEKSELVNSKERNASNYSDMKQEIYNLKMEFAALDDQKKKWLEMLKNGEVDQLKMELNMQASSGLKKGIPNNNVSQTAVTKMNWRNGSKEDSLHQLLDEIKRFKADLTDLEKKKNDWLQMLNNGQIDDLKKELSTRAQSNPETQKKKLKIKKVGDIRGSGQINKKEGNLLQAHSTAQNEDYSQDLSKEIEQLRILLSSMYPPQQLLIPTPEQKDKDEIGMLREQLRTQANQLEKHQQERRKLEQKMADVQQQNNQEGSEQERQLKEEQAKSLKEMTLEIQRLRNDLGQMEAEKNSWEDKVNPQKAEELTRLRKDIAKKEAEASDQKAKFEATVKKEQARLEAQVEQNKALRSKNEAFADQLQDLNAQMETLRSLLGDNSTETNQLQIQNMKMQQEKIQAQEKAKALTNSIQEMQDEKVKQEEHCKLVTEKLSESQQKVGQLEQQLRRIKDRMDQQTREFNERLEREAQGTKQHIEELQDRIEEIQMSEARTQSDYQVAIKELEHTRKRECDLMDLTKRLQGDFKQTDAGKQQALIMLKQHSQKVVEYKSKLAELDLQKKVEHYQAESIEREMLEWVEKLKQIELLMQEEKTQWDTEKNEMKKAHWEEMERERAKQADEIDKLRQELMEGTMKQKSRRTVEVEEMKCKHQAELKRLQDEIEAKRRIEEEALQQQSAFQKQMADKDIELAGLTTQLNMQQQQIRDSADKDTELADMSTQLSILKQQLKDSTKDRQNKDQSLSQKEMEVDTLKSQVAVLKQQLLASKANESSLLDQLTSAASSQLQTQVETSFEIAGGSASNPGIDLERKKLEDKCSGMRRKLQQMKEDKDDLQIRFDQLSKQFESIKISYQETKTLYLEFKASNDEMAIEFEQLKLKEERTAKELAQLKKKSSFEASDLQLRLTKNEREIKVLKDSVWAGSTDKTELERDIYKLHIRIERLEKMVQFREQLIYQVAMNLRNGIDVDTTAILQKLQANKMDTSQTVTTKKKSIGARFRSLHTPAGGAQSHNTTTSKFMHSGSQKQFTIHNIISAKILPSTPRMGESSSLPPITGGSFSQRRKEAISENRESGTGTGDKGTSTVSLLSQSNVPKSRQQQQKQMSLLSRQSNKRQTYTQPDYGRASEGRKVEEDINRNEPMQPTDEVNPNFYRTLQAPFFGISSNNYDAQLDKYQK